MWLWGGFGLAKLEAEVEDPLSTPLVLFPRSLYLENCYYSCRLHSLEGIGHQVFAGHQKGTGKRNEPYRHNVYKQQNLY